MVAGRVIVDPFVPLERARELLGGLGVAVEAPPPWTGDDVVGLVSWNPVGEDELGRLPALRVVATPSVGYDHIDLGAAARRGVWVCHVPDAYVEEMADSALALLLAVARGIVVLDRHVRAGGWDYRAAGPLRRIKDVRLGVIGFGRIGRALAARSRALGMDVWVTDPFVADEEIAAAGFRPAPLDELLVSCQAFSLHAPLNPETAGLIGEAELERMPPGSLLVNTARAGLVDEDALLRALESGHLAGAAIDVLPAEPPTEEEPAPGAPTLVVTPHAAWYTPRAEEELARRAVLAVRAVLEGREPDGAIVRPEGRTSA